ncbi:Aste57867_13292 [Aphanomyces stellatus]|uniref:Aste57867_13292 protein n=1 Tax=Aphanomyces stellatus TaxID=120398 RepID=A0A485KXR6_9STRA|nr:hypothetical protein As57867_013243 [Aphanomyces stellatus]VFT90131.1 Aste57867_13292 [Aphanomyces stellatus]
MDEQKQAEALRLRRYRSAKKVELATLKQHIFHLEAALSRLKSKALAPGNVGSQHDATTALAILCRYNQSLREKVKTHAKLAQVLAAWVTSHHPPLGVSRRSTWVESTLLDDPTARHQGFQWLSQRVYYMALASSARPAERLERSEAYSFRLHTYVNDDGETNIAAMDLQLQTIYFTNATRIGRGLWHRLSQNQLAIDSVLPTTTVVETVQDKTVYHCGVYEGNDVRSCRIMTRFEDTDERVVITFCLVKDDERRALEEGEFRTHGLGWAVFERVTDGITKLRFSVVHYAPRTRRGRASLAEIGQLYGLSNKGIEHRDAYIERLRRVIGETFIQGIQHGADQLRQL